MSSLLWIGGSWCLFLLARRLASDLGAAVAVGFYLFLPYSILASRSFQPDPMMVALMLAGILALVRHHDHPSAPRLALAAAISGAATFVKPVSIIFLVSVFGALALRRRVERREGWTLLFRQAGTFLVLGLGPGIVFYVAGILTRSELESQAQMSFIPDVLLTRAF